jgi:hypothetical protein
VVVHEADNEVLGDVVLNTPRCCNKFYLMLQNSMHVATIVFGCFICVDFPCCNLSSQCFTVL